MQKRPTRAAQVGLEDHELPKNPTDTGVGAQKWLRGTTSGVRVQEL